jgi:hypothetical protein
MTEEVQPRRQQPSRLSERVELGGDYEGWWVRFQMNVPMGALEDLDSQDVTRVFAALGEIVVESNFVDRHGEPIDVTTHEGWRRVGRDLVAELIRAFKDTLASPLAKRRPTSSRPTSPDTDESSPLVTA